jgi:hypothetical protein
MKPIKKINEILKYSFKFIRSMTYEKILLKSKAMCDNLKKSTENH